jgi:hypothetical protein
MWRATLAAARETWYLMGLLEQVLTYVEITIDTEMTSANGSCIMSTMVLLPECRHLSSGNCADSYLSSLLTRFVSIAALIRRYSPSAHPLLRLLSHVPAIPSSD